MEVKSSSLTAAGEGRVKMMKNEIGSNWRSGGVRMTGWMDGGREARDKKVIT